MSGCVNKWIGMGNLGEDPTGKQIGDGENNFVAECRIACNENWVDKDGQKQEHTEWVTLICWGKRGKALAKWFKKGDGIFAEGRLKTRDWEGDDGKKHYKTEVIVSNWEFPPGKGKKQEEGF